MFSIRRQSFLRKPLFAWRSMRARMNDWALGIDTAPPDLNISPRAARFDDSVHFEAVDYPLLRKYLRPLTLSRDDVAFDIGCGTGRILCILARMPIRRCVGLEISPELARVAQENAARLCGRRAQIQVIHGDATDADYSEGTIYCMFNPFGEKTLRAVLDRIHDSLTHRPRRVQIAYLNPVHENVLEDSGWLHRTGRGESIWYTMTASYFSNEAGARLKVPA